MKLHKTQKFQVFLIQKYQLWFEHLKNSYIHNFLEYIKFNENEKEFRLLLGKMNYQTFDYIIYIYWCILKKEYKLLCMKDYNINRCWSLESASFEIYNEVKKKMNYTTNMVIGCCYLNNKEKFNNDKPMLIYHLDRIGKRDPGKT